MLVVTHARKVHRDLDVLGVPTGQHRLHEDIDRVLVVKVCRDQAQAQTLVRVAGIRKTLGLPSALAHRCKQLAVQGSHRQRRELVAVERGHGGAGAHLGQGPFLLSQLGIQGQRFVHLAQTACHCSPQGTRARLRRYSLGARQGGQCQIHLPRLDIAMGQVPQGRCAVRVQLGVALQDRLRLLPQVKAKRRLRQTHQGVFGGGLRGLGQHLHGVLTRVDAQQQLTQVDQHLATLVQ